MNPLGLVLKAAQFAAHKHRDQRRKDEDKTPYINHPLTVARALVEEGGVEDPEILAAALLHDTIEDTETTYDELLGQFGERIAKIVVEVTDDKTLDKQTRKDLQVAKASRVSAAAQQVKIADKLCNLRDILASPPADWSLTRKQEYFDWAKKVVDQIREANPGLAGKFDELYEQRLAISEIDQARRSMTNHAMARDHSTTRTPVTKNSVSAKQEIGIHLCCS